MTRMKSYLIGFRKYYVLTVHYCKYDQDLRKRVEFIKPRDKAYLLHQTPRLLLYPVFKSYRSDSYACKIPSNLMIISKKTSQTNDFIKYRCVEWYCNDKMRIHVITSCLEPAACVDVLFSLDKSCLEVELLFHFEVLLTYFTNTVAT